MSTIETMWYLSPEDNQPYILAVSREHGIAAALGGGRLMPLSGLKGLFLPATPPPDAQFHLEGVELCTRPPLPVPPEVRP